MSDLYPVGMFVYVKRTEGPGHKGLEGYGVVKNVLKSFQVIVSRALALKYGDETLYSRAQPWDRVIIEMFDNDYGINYFIASVTSDIGNQRLLSRDVIISAADRGNYDALQIFKGLGSE